MILIKRLRSKYRNKSKTTKKSYLFVLKLVQLVIFNTYIVIGKVPLFFLGSYFEYRCLYARAGKLTDTLTRGKLVLGVSFFFFVPNQTYSVRCVNPSATKPTIVAIGSYILA